MLTAVNLTDQFPCFVVQLAINLAIGCIIIVDTGFQSVLPMLHEFLGTVLIVVPVSYTHLRAHETVLDLVCRLLLEKKKNILTQFSQLHRHITLYNIY